MKYVIDKLNPSNAEFIKEYMISHGLKSLIQWMEKNAVAFAKFSLRIIFREFPEEYWRKAVKSRFPDFSEEFRTWIHLLESDVSLKERLIDFIAESLVNGIVEIRKIDIPYLPSSGVILDIGFGYLGMSKKLVAEALRNKDLLLYLIDNAELPCKVAIRVLEKLGNPRNIKVLRVSAERLPFEDNYVDAITMLGTLHELSREIYRVELRKSLENLKIDKEFLEKVQEEYDTFFREFCRILKRNGILIIMDKIMDDYDLDFAIRLTEPYFTVISKRKEEKLFFLVAKK